MAEFRLYTSQTRRGRRQTEGRTAVLIARLSSPKQLPVGTTRLRSSDGVHQLRF